MTGSEQKGRRGMRRQVWIMLMAGVTIAASAIASRPVPAEAQSNMCMRDGSKANSGCSLCCRGYCSYCAPTGYYC